MHPNTKDLTGIQFGKLTAIEILGKDAKGRIIWNCTCSCTGRTKPVLAAYLSRGTTGSCGCDKFENASKSKRKPPGHAARRVILSQYIYGAKIRNLEFRLSEEKFIELMTSDCFYCGSAPSRIQKSSSNIRKDGVSVDGGDFICGGIDRVDSDIGYTIQNCVPCCYTCNIGKNKMSIREFEDWVHKTSDFLRSKNNG